MRSLTQLYGGQLELNQSADFDKLMFGDDTHPWIIVSLFLFYLSFYWEAPLSKPFGAHLRARKTCVSFSFLRTLDNGCSYHCRPPPPWNRGSQANSEFVWCTKVTSFGPINIPVSSFTYSYLFKMLEGMWNLWTPMYFPQGWQNLLQFS